ncbi:TetR/AcrR family transcriptional regulator [Paenibacillus sp. VCA1]|uniref:TetR/AcrR family transcriptional regulator n=1 Tax=Paenibacillus sp. VCA1 TaxID=3039148 RepID=UPI00287135E1|nr:TetR/AcrR family transcriptional regulator [Paenibacillus sp. VCA1]MDR9853674.1 TetR/AcrR family transcriptional regulator [Paenibacillus sp. VCA1]
MNKPIDPRVTRTRRLLMDALTELIVEEGVDAITIRDIVRKAEVNRSTFYLHFRDKQDILDQMQDDILNELAQTLKFPTYYEEALHDYKSSKKPIQSHVTMFEHIQKHASFYRTMLTEGEFRERMTQVIRTEALQYKHNFWDAAFASHGVVGIILYWLENGMKESILEMSLWLTRVSLFPLGKFD